jgi:aspartyl-tRNA(Asn)/glutamyl-tRNA(Gln) amidotransferase subunit A
MMNTWYRLLKDAAGQQEYRELVEKRNESLNCFLEFDPARRSGPGAVSAGSTGSSAGVLAGLPFAVKDNIAVKGFSLTCGSKILQNLLSPYDATAVARLIEAGAIPVGKTNLDEFGMGSSNQHSAFGGAANPWDLSRVPGGSSGGSAAAVAAGLVPFALGSDTGGSVRQPAAFCGVYGLKPTYGTVSRYGLVAYASSLDVIGMVARDIDLLREVYRTIAGEDPRDHSSTNPAPGTHAAAGEPAKEWRPQRVAFLGGSLELDPAIQSAYDATRQELESQGITVEEIELSTLKYVVPAYYTIATAEASANLARYNGVRYGRRPDFAENPDELVRTARDNGFGAEVKSRILLGTYVLRSGFQDQYYLRAQRIRTAIRNELAAAFGSYDLLILPVFPVPAFPRGEAGLTDFQQKLADRFTSTANLAGTPALTIPTGTDKGLPLAVQAMAPAFEEERLFSLARILAGRFPPEAPADFPPFVATGAEA